MFKMSAFSVDTDDASIRRWSGSQQIGPVRTTRRSDAHAARRHPCLCCGTHAACLVLYIFFRFRLCKNYWNLLRFDRVSVKCTLLRFMNHGKNVGFDFFQVKCAHKLGDVTNFIIVACIIFSRLKWHKNYKNRLSLAKVIVKNKVSRFLWFTVYKID